MFDNFIKRPSFKNLLLIEWGFSGFVFHMVEFQDLMRILNNQAPCNKITKRIKNCLSIIDQWNLFTDSYRRALMLTFKILHLCLICRSFHAKLIFKIIHKTSLNNNEVSMQTTTLSAVYSCRFFLIHATIHRHKRTRIRCDDVRNIQNK